MHNKYYTILYYTIEAEIRQYECATFLNREGLRRGFSGPFFAEKNHFAGYFGANTTETRRLPRSHGSAAQPDRSAGGGFLSRSAACHNRLFDKLVDGEASSPGSILPPGNSQRPLNSP